MKKYFKVHKTNFSKIKKTSNETDPDKKKENEINLNGKYLVKKRKRSTESQQIISNYYKTETGHKRKKKQ